jgi:nucleotide sugar dehydrogenase
MNSKSNVVVFGLGYVGLPLSLSFAMRGCNVYGVDISQNLVKEISSGITYHTEKYKERTIQEILKEQLSNGNFRATTDAKSIPGEYHNFIVTVGIPVKDGNHDYSGLEGCCRSLGSMLKEGDLVIIRSTVIPGATEEFILPILESESGLKAGRDFYLGYSSERIAEGNAFEEFINMPTVVGGINEESLQKAADVLSIVCDAEIIKATNIKAVETSKVIENVQRDVNIAMVQEFARFAEKLGIDIFEVIKIANTHKRVHLLSPGPGVGGYCIPNAYYYIEPKAKELGVNVDLLKLSRVKNEALPEVIVGMLEDQMKESGKSLEGSKIAVLGIAMKDYSNDDRISPPVSIVNLLIQKKADVYVYDPVVPTKYQYKYDNLEDAIKDADALLVLARQSLTDAVPVKSFEENLKKNAVIFDTRNMFKDTKQEFINKGIKYYSL